MKAVKKVSTQLADLNKVQENIQAAVDPIIMCPLVNGVLLVNIRVLTGQANMVPHKLGRRPRGWFVVSPKQDVRVWEEFSELPSSMLKLQSSANATINLWVF